MTCICCGKTIEREAPHLPPIAPETDMWDGAVVSVLWAGFGSKFDTIGFVVAVCDECVDQKLEQGVIDRSHARNS